MAKTYTQEEIKLMTPEERSAAWHGADDASRQALHAANTEALSPTHTYNSEQGTWTEKTVTDRLSEVQAATDANIKDIGDTYGGIIDQTEKFYQQQADALAGIQQTQTELVNQQTDAAIAELERQKAENAEDLEKEKSAAYVDWRKQSAQHGVNAEMMASLGLQGSGYSESAQIAMYTAYQNRVAVARENQKKIEADFNIAIQEARLQNSSKLAEIALQTLQTRLELNMQAFENTQALKLEMFSQQQAAEQQGYNRYQDVLAQIAQEEALAEEIRQFNIENGVGTGVGSGVQIAPTPTVDTATPTPGTVGAAEPTIKISGIGEVTAETAEQLEQAGAIILEGTDKNGEPLYKKTAQKVNFNYSTRM